MRGGWQLIAWVLGTAAVAVLAGCATDAGGRRTETTDRLRPPAEPLYRRTFITPSGREWDFVLGGGYDRDR